MVINILVAVALLCFVVQTARPNIKLDLTSLGLAALTIAWIASRYLPCK